MQPILPSFFSLVRVAFLLIAMAPQRSISAIWERKRTLDAVTPGTPMEELVGDDVEITADGRVIYPQEKDDPDCKNEEELCEFWASVDECQKNPNYMHVHCAKACGTCHKKNTHLANAKRKATHATTTHTREETTLPKKILDSESTTAAQQAELPTLLKQVANYGKPQKAKFPGNKPMEPLVHLVIRQTISYMKNFVHAKNPTHKMDPTILSLCRNEEEECSLWAAEGECDNNPSYMLVSCSAACRSCDKIQFETRCPPRSADIPPALQKGELNLMFERIVQNASYTVTVHSRPESKAPQPNEKGIIPSNVARNLKENPWVITMENFLTHEECDRLITLGHEAKYERSRDVAGLKTDGTIESMESNSRTSENAWCSKQCRQDPMVQRILQRIEAVTTIPSENYEDFQILKYEVGQFYKPHHDFIPHQADRAAGPRILTFFLYLSDVEEGGGTNFPLLNNLEILPKKGRALLWPSIYDHDLLRDDYRMRHEAKPVIDGRKYAANVWIHLFEHEEASKRGCV